MIINPLYSSSSGNLFLLEDNNTNILIDAGVSYKKICEALLGLDKSISSLDAILITHEHTDHIKGLDILCKNNPNIPIYTTKLTSDYLKENFKNINNIIDIEYEKTFNINDINITAFETSHDALMPCGYYINNNNVSLTFATDLGYISDNILNYMDKSNYIVLESNYDNIMLDYGSYPFSTKKRIKSNIGHLSNIDSANVLFNLLNKDNSKEILLSHLSCNNNSIPIARDTIMNHLNSNNICDCNISFATKNLSFERYFI